MMSRLERASLLEAGEALQALFRGEDSEDAAFAALFLAKALGAMIALG